MSICHICDAPLASDDLGHTMRWDGKTVPVCSPCSLAEQLVNTTGNYCITSGGSPKACGITSKEWKDLVVKTRKNTDRYYAKRFPNGK